MSNILHAAVCEVCNGHTGYSHGPVEGSFICSRCIAPRNTRLPKPPAPSKQPDPPKKTKFVTDFMPAGRSGLYIYAVVIKQHPDKVKIGMTRKWVNRRRAYANWDLSPGDAIVEERVFCINEDFIDLEKLEAHILETFGAPRAFGAEWFNETIDEAARHIDRIMCANGISYDM